MRILTYAELQAVSAGTPENAEKAARVLKVLNIIIGGSLAFVAVVTFLK